MQGLEGWFGSAASMGRDLPQDSWSRRTKPCLAITHVASQAKKAMAIPDGMRVKLAPAVLEMRSGPNSAATSTTSQMTLIASAAPIPGTRSRLRRARRSGAASGCPEEMVVIISTSFGRAGAELADARDLPGQADERGRHGDPARDPVAACQHEDAEQEREAQGHRRDSRSADLAVELLLVGHGNSPPPRAKSAS